MCQRERERAWGGMELHPLSRLKSKVFVWMFRLQQKSRTTSSSLRYRSTAADCFQGSIRNDRERHEVNAMNCIHLGSAVV